MATSDFDILTYLVRNCLIYVVNQGFFCRDFVKKFAKIRGNHPSNLIYISIRKEKNNHKITYTLLKIILKLISLLNRFLESPWILPTFNKKGSFRPSELGKHPFYGQLTTNRWCCAKRSITNCSSELPAR